MLDPLSLLADLFATTKKRQTTAERQRYNQEYLENVQRIMTSEKLSGRLVITEDAEFEVIEPKQIEDKK